MSIQPPRYVAVAGVRFLAAPVYAESRSVDELARFFYEEVLPRENEITRLRRLFDLPTRLVDEVLADLLLQRHAVLDVSGRRILRVGKPVPRPRYATEPDVEFWQDGVTGVIMRLRDIPGIYRYGARVVTQSGVIHLAEQELDESRHFRSMPGARLVEMLRTTAPRMAVLLDGSSLETVIERRFRARETLYLPVGHTSMDLGDIFYVQAPELPSHLTSSWSRELRRHVGGQSVSHHLLTILPDSGSESSKPTIWEATSIAEGIAPLVESSERLDRELDWEAVNSTAGIFGNRRDSLLERLDSVVGVRHSRPKAAYGSHMEEMWRLASRYLLLVVERGTEPAIQAMLETFRPTSAWNCSLFVVGVEGLIRRLPQNMSPDMLRVFAVGSDSNVGLCVRDGVELRLGSLPELTGAGELLQLSGGPMPSVVAQSVLGRARLAASSAFIEGVLSSANSNAARREALAVMAVDLTQYDRLTRVVQALSAATERAVQRARPLWLSYERAQLQSEWKRSRRDETDEDSSDPDISVPKSTSEIEPSIRELRAELLERSEGLPEPLSACLQPSELSPWTMLVDVVRSALVHSGVRSIFISFDEGGERLEDAERRLLLDRLLQEHIDVTFYLNPLPTTPTTWDQASVQAFEQLHAVNPGHRVKYLKGHRRVPTAAILDASFVVIGQRSWFDDGSGREIILAMDAAHLAREILMVAGEEP